MNNTTLILFDKFMSVFDVILNLDAESTRIELSTRTLLITQHQHHTLMLKLNLHQVSMTYSYLLFLLFKKPLY